MSGNIVCRRDLHMDIYSPESIAKSLREAADQLEAQKQVEIVIRIGVISVVLDAESEEIYVIA